MDNFIPQANWIFASGSTDPIQLDKQERRWFYPTKLTNEDGTKEEVTFSTEINLEKFINDKRIEIKAKTFIEALKAR